jgi:sugar (pentulose or hexulose) kinase
VRASEATSLGCHTDLWAPAAGRLSSLVERERWGGLFPPLRPAASVLGPLLPAVAAATGLACDIPVACGIHDSNASLLPWLGRLEPPFTVISSGTWTIVMTVGGGLAGLDPGRDVLANVDAFGRPVPTARFMGGREHAAIAGAAPAPSTPADVQAVIDGGALALPSFVSGVGPFPGGVGGMEGDGALGAGGRTALADLYLALVTRECLTLAGVGARIVVEGPLARNASFCGLVAALTGVPVHPSPDATGTAMGAALLLDPPGAPSGEVPAAVPPLAVAGLDAYARRWRERAGR